jgi:hypothetical protein
MMLLTASWNTVLEKRIIVYNASLDYHGLKQITRRFCNQKDLTNISGRQQEVGRCLRISWKFVGTRFWQKGVSVWQIVWVMTNCCFMRNLIWYLESYNCKLYVCWHNWILVWDFDRYRNHGNERASKNFHDFFPIAYLRNIICVEM